MATYYRDKLEIIRKACNNDEMHMISECFEDMDFQDTFPEDMCESRTDWDTLRERLSTAYCAIDDLIDIIERLQGET